MLKKPTLLLIALTLAWGCGDDDDGPTGGEGGGLSSGGRGGANSGGSATSGGAVSSGGAGVSGAVNSGGKVGSGGSVNSGGSTAAGAAGAPAGGSAGDGAGGSAGAASGGTAGTGTAGGGGDAGSGTAGSGGDGTAGGGGAPAGGSGGAGGSENPACKTIAPEATVTSHLKFTTDNECEVFVNGASVGKSTSWGSAVTVDVSLFLHPGRKNVVAIVGTNTSSQAGVDRGIVGELTVDKSGGGTQAVIWSDHEWRVAPTEETGWTGLEFDDSAWIAATEVANMGEGPWGAVIPGSSAKWIWSAAVPSDTGSKPNLESTYARRVFYLAVDGQSTTNTPSCSEPQ